jgi:hypothetical protein
MEYNFKDALLSSKLIPKTEKTALGVVEYVEIGEGPVVVALHGAMGGWDQNVILAQTIGDMGYRYIAMTRPGYLGTPMRSGKSPEQQGDLIAALLDTLVPFETHAKMYKARVPNAELLSVDGGEHVAIFTHRHWVRPKVIEFMNQYFKAVPI